MSPFAIDVHGRSLKARGRPRNEDRFAIAALPAARRAGAGPGAGLVHALVVADGVAACTDPAGASALAVEALLGQLAARPPSVPLGSAQAAEVLRQALLATQRELERRCGGPPEGRAGPEDPAPGAGSGWLGTTLTVALVAWPELLVAHAGDSRCFVQRDGEARQLTTDHTLAALRRAMGAEPRAGDRETLWNAVGGSGEALHAEIVHFALAPADVVVLCTDGVRSAAEAASLARHLRPGLDAAGACRALVRDEDSDDQTVVVARFLLRAGSTEPPELARGRAAAADPAAGGAPPARGPESGARHCPRLPAR